MSRRNETGLDLIGDCDDLIPASEQSYLWRTDHD